MILGRYELLELIGKGGMGSVYRSRHPNTGQIIAIKVLDAEMARHPILLKRFEQECEVAIRLRHPHIVEGIEFGVIDDKPYLVMEYVEGLNLADRVSQQGPLTEAETIRIGIEIGSALQAAHEANLIHRDVKPENILLTRTGQSKLTDLGLVKDLEGDEQLTRSGAWLGTISYMAPEQFGDAGKVDARCDVYGLAGTLYFGLTGTSPFPQKGSLTVLGNKLKNRFLVPRQVNPAISDSVSEILVQGLAADRKLRLASCAVLVERLQKVGSGTSVPKPAPPPNAAPDDPERRQPAPPPNADPDDPERRRARRFPTTIGAVCKPVRSGIQEWSAKVEDVSLSGLRILLNRRFESASVLEIKATGANAQEATFLVRVMWVRQAGTGLWNHGCAFGRSIAESDLEVFLKGISTTIVQKPTDSGPRN